jgi:hypothetical protein
MNTFFRFLVIATALSVWVGQVSRTQAAPPFGPSFEIDTGALVKQIALQFKEVNAAAANFYKQKRELSTDFSSEGGSMVRSFDASGKLRKIVCENYGAIGRTHEEYYVLHDSLFFAFIKEYTYIEPISVNMNPAIKKVIENRYYFYQGNIIQWLVEKQKKNPAEFSKTSF